MVLPFVPLVPMSISSISMAIERDYRPACHFAYTSTLVTACVAIATGALFATHQLSPPGRRRTLEVRYRPSPALRVLLLTFLAAASCALIGIWMMRRSVGVYDVVSLAIVWICIIRIVTARLETDRDGVRWSRPIGSTWIAWSDLDRFEVRGTSFLRRRILAILRDGSERLVWIFDSRVPIVRDISDELVSELEDVRTRSAPRP